MILETKYNIGDSLWFIDNNKIFNLKVDGVDAQFRNYSLRPGLQTLYIFFEKETDYRGCSICHSIWEKDLYTTKEELLNSL